METTTLSADALLYAEVQQLLAREAALLDERRFEEWLEMLSEDVRYWMPTVRSVDDPDDALTDSNGLAWFDEDHGTLAMRVRRLSSPLAHAEHPASRTRRFVFVTNVARIDAHDVAVSANFLVYRSRKERDVDIFAGARYDTLQHDGDRWKIVSRMIRLDQNIVENRDMSLFF